MSGNANAATGYCAPYQVTSQVEDLARTDQISPRVTLQAFVASDDNPLVHAGTRGEGASLKLPELNDLNF